MGATCHNFLHTVHVTHFRARPIFLCPVPHLFASRGEVGRLLAAEDKALDDFEKSVWLTVSGLGDRDTTCAIVGGIVALAVGENALPCEWERRCEGPPF